jgi:hypothetical protein
MRFQPTETQLRRVAAVLQVIESCGGQDRAASISAGCGYDRELDERLCNTAELAGGDNLDRYLVAEELARAGVAATFGLRGLLSDLLPAALPHGPIAVLDVNRHGPTRFAAAAPVLVVLDGDEAHVLDSGEFAVEKETESFGYPYAHIRSRGGGVTLPQGTAERLRSRWRLALIAEIAGNAESAIAGTSAHLCDRVQFGRPLSSLQALRHRLADAGVSAESVRWLGREAAYFDDLRRVVRAAWCASDTAAALVPELVQMCGARSFTLEFGLHVYTMRMGGARLELGSTDRLGAELDQITELVESGSGADRF